MEEENIYFEQNLTKFGREVWKLDHLRYLVENVTEVGGNISNELSEVKRILQHSNDLTEDIIFCLQIITILFSLTVIILFIFICTKCKARKKQFPFICSHISLEDQTNIL